MLLFLFLLSNLGMVCFLGRLSAGVISAMVNDINSTNIKPESVHSTVENSLKLYQICVIVRTHVGQANLLPITLLSLTQQSYRGLDVNLSISVVNTDPESYMESDFMHSAAADVNLKAGSVVVTVLDKSFHSRPPIRGVYGYDTTDLVLHSLLARESICTHFLFTNGDNFYSRSFIYKIQPLISEGKQLIAWDYITHHPRDYNVIKVQIIRGHVDLGSVLVNRQAIELNSTEVKFLPQGRNTGDLFARDFFFFKQIYDKVGEENVGLIHQVLFAHQ